MGLTSKQKYIVVVLLSGTLLAVLNMTLIASAISAIMGDMGVDATTVQWLTSGYALVEAVVIPMNAYLVGRFSTRRLFIVAMAWFALGSAAVAFAQVFWVMLLGRVMQAMATGVAMPMVFTLILLMFPRERRGSAMGVVGLVVAFVHDAEEPVSEVLPTGIPGLDRPWTVSDVMNPDAKRLPEGASVRLAVQLLRESETSGLPIVNDDDAVIGFVSDGDIVKHLARQSALIAGGSNIFRLVDDADFLERFDALMSMRALDVATRNVITINASDDPEQAFKLLAERRIKKLPVVSDGKLVGSISRRNIIAVLDGLALQRADDAAGMAG